METTAIQGFCGRSIRKFFLGGGRTFHRVVSIGLSQVREEELMLDCL